MPGGSAGVLSPTPRMKCSAPQAPLARGEGGGGAEALWRTRAWVVNRQGREAVVADVLTGPGSVGAQRRRRGLTSGAHLESLHMPQQAEPREDQHAALDLHAVDPDEPCTLEAAMSAWARAAGRGGASG
eukprot:COSAG04_NODE_19243_length_421_cov_0.633540_1_plen_128_part_01